MGNFLASKKISKDKNVKINEFLVIFDEKFPKEIEVDLQEIYKESDFFHFPCKFLVKLFHF